jgi:hypothetical protein
MIGIADILDQQYQHTDQFLLLFFHVGVAKHQSQFRAAFK